jgi:hypothetical protein
VKAPATDGREAPRPTRRRGHDCCLRAGLAVILSAARAAADSALRNSMNVNL